MEPGSVVLAHDQSLGAARRRTSGAPKLDQSLSRRQHSVGGASRTVRWSIMQKSSEATGAGAASRPSSVPNYDGPPGAGAVTGRPRTNGDGGGPAVRRGRRGPSARPTFVNEACRRIRQAAVGASRSRRSTLPSSAAAPAAADATAIVL